MPITQRKERDLRIDFFRGLALIFIFIDHVPDNSWASLTLRNFGFADASEVFVLLAGYSAGLAYWSTIDRGGFQAAFNRASRRASEIYIWHLGVFIASAILLYAASRIFNNADYVNHVAINGFTTDPTGTVLSALALFYQPNQMNILPMYVVLMFWLPFVIVLLRKSVAMTLAISFAIWAIANVAGLNLPTHQRAEGWFFNPFAWQLLFTTGAAVAVLARRMPEERPDSPLLIPAALYVVFAFLVTAPWMQWSLLPKVQLISRDVVEPMSKHDLSAWRFAHVLALAYLTAIYVPSNAAWLKKSWAVSIQACGKHSLEIFSLGTLLSFFGWIALTELGTSQTMMLMVNVIGITIMGVTAWQMARRKQSRVSSRPRQRPAEALAT